MPKLVLEVNDPTRARLVIADALSLKADILSWQGKGWDALEAQILGQMALDAPTLEEATA